MKNISKPLLDNWSQILSVYFSGKNGDRAVSPLDLDFIDLEDFGNYLKGKLLKHTFIDLLFNLGQSALRIGSNKVAEEVFELIVEESKGDEKLIDYTANASLELGKILALKFFWKESLLKINYANELYGREKNFKSSFYCEILSGLIFEEIGGYLNARKHFANCLNLVNDRNDNERMGFVFSNLGLLEFYQNNLEGAISNFRRSEIYYQKVGNRIKILEVKYNLSLLYLLIKDYNNAFREIEETIFNNETKSYFTANEKIYVNKVKMFIERNDFTFAIPLNHTSFDIYGFRASNDIIEYIYQLKTAISNNVNSVYKEYPATVSASQKNGSTITII